MFDWEKTKVVKMKRPNLWSGTLKEQEDLYNVLLAYFCWLYIREDLNEHLILYTQSLHAYENWCTRLPTVFGDKSEIIDEAYEETLKRFECDIVFKPSDSMCEDATFYYDLARGKKIFLYEDVYKLLDFVYMMCDSYKVYDYDNM
jgi:hypothetical protein